jgi:hypothetical protein
MSNQVKRCCSSLINTHSQFRQKDFSNFTDDGRSRTPGGSYMIQCLACACMSFQNKVCFQFQISIEILFFSEVSKIT